MVRFHSQVRAVVYKQIHYDTRKGEMKVAIKIVSRHGCLEKSGNKDYILSFIDRVLERIDPTKFGIKRIVFMNCRGNRGYYSKGDAVNLDPSTKSFSPDYRGYKYKTFGGVADLTPGGVFAHELGHAFHKFVGSDLTKVFKSIRKQKRRSITSYGTKSVGEDIAESFRLYVTNPNKLREIDAERYMAIDQFCVNLNMLSVDDGVKLSEFPFVMNAIEQMILDNGGGGVNKAYAFPLSMSEQLFIVNGVLKLYCGNKVVSIVNRSDVPRYDDKDWENFCVNQSILDVLVCGEADVMCAIEKKLPGGGIVGQLLTDVFNGEYPGIWK